MTKQRIDKLKQFFIDTADTLSTVSKKEYAIAAFGAGLITAATVLMQQTPEVIANFSTVLQSGIETASPILNTLKEVATPPSIEDSYCTLFAKELCSAIVDVSSITEPIFTRLSEGCIAAAISTNIIKTH
ncbi:MAG: hypothetical protein GY804_07945 [Alphaproteobacteria bacterium]|nr:hypothetical protein [Alphaproteobacteria bacterium]